ncbi:EmrB/QacA subfamily drug resistance transporter [Prauserella shujinwangii]|uniref:EmrB/QacA subfamily drug resistance transporter n=1 Tax=Prauserella shujinwangii TaxID=1453103 RepID=A0A2T0M2J5_9PSEU|nr:MFS transporter [Prauserella shujinwangii]PRX50975.1 EmrB/QacA subfamily drug resistance transporter [Prauserella shujinwangii]
MTAFSSRSRRWSALAVLCLVQFMLVLDDTAVNVALATIRAELGFGTASLTWVADAYFLAFGGPLLLFGRAADVLGRRRLFLTGVLLFAVASAACGLARAPWQLVAGRFGQGIGAAMAAPAALALISVLFPGERERARAFAAWGAIAVGGGVSGLVFSGVLTGLASWRWIFLGNVPVALIALLSLPHLVPESRAGGVPRLGVPGTVLGTGAVVSGVYGLLHAAESGWADPVTVLALGLGGALAVAFAAVERRSAGPLIPRSFLAARTRAVAVVVSLPFTGGFFAMSFLLMLHVQTVLGLDPLRAGLAFLPYGAGILTGVATSAHLVARLGTRRALIAAFLAAACGLLLLAAAVPGAESAVELLPGMVVAGLGAGAGFPALTVAALAGSGGDDAGIGSAVLTTAQQLGGAVGLALLVGLAVARRGTDITDGAAFAFLVTAGALTLSSAVITAALPRARDTLSSTQDTRGHVQ